MPDFLLRKGTGELEIVSGTEPFTVTPTAGGGTYDVYRLDNGGTVTLAGSDTQAPDVSSLTVTLTEDDAVLEWSTNEASGSAYWVCTTQVDVPSATQIIAGQDHTGAAAEASGVEAVTSSGLQNSQPVGGLIEGETYAFHLLHQDASGNTSAVLTNTALIPNDDDIAPALRYLEASVLGTTATLTLSTDEANGVLYWVLSDDAQTPDSGQLVAGLGSDGATPIASGSQPVTQTDGQPAITVSGLTPDSTYYFHVMHRDAVGNDSATDSVTFLVTDAQAPVLSGVGVALSGTTATLNWSSDEGNGTGYWVCSTSATVPSEAQIIAGNNHSGAPALASGMQAVSQPGSQAAQVVTGLSEGPTYFFHLLHRDGSGNTSSVASTTGVTVSSASATINIVRRSALWIAPEAFVFDLSLSGFDTPGAASGAVYDPQFHELYYLWDFGDAYDFEAPAHLETGHEKAGVGYGPTVAHTYRNAGNYEVSCLIIEPSSGKSTTARLNIAVGNPEQTFPGTNTIFVDTVGGAPGAPQGARVMNSLEAAWGAATGQQSAPKRIMLARGQTFSISGGGLGNSGSNSMSSLHIVAAPGTGEKPIVNASGMILWSDSTTTGNGNDKDFVVQGLDWRGQWNGVTESGNSYDGFLFLVNPPRQALFDGNEMSGLASILATSGSDPSMNNAMLVANDNIMTNWRLYAVFGRYGINVLTGNRLAHNPNGLGGGPRSANAHTEGGPIRMPTPLRSIIHANDMFSNAGWFSNVESYYTTQPCMRWNTTPQRGAILNMQCNSLEGGYTPLEIKSQNRDPGFAVNAVCEKNTIAGNFMTAYLITCEFGGTTFRNNRLIQPDVDRFVGIFNPRAFVNLDYHGSNAENGGAPIQIYNNTFLSQLTPGNRTDGVATPSATVEADAAFTAVTEHNNIDHQPHLGRTADGPLSTEVLWPMRYIGYQDSDTPLQSQYETPDTTVVSAAPLSGSEALGDAVNEPVAFDDLFGNPRPQYPSRGATEMP
jgi:hypothetical protein